MVKAAPVIEAIRQRVTVMFWSTAIRSLSGGCVLNKPDIIAAHAERSDDKQSGR